MVPRGSYGGGVFQLLLRRTLHLAENDMTIEMIDRRKVRVVDRSRSVIQNDFCLRIFLLNTSECNASHAPLVVADALAVEHAQRSKRCYTLLIAKDRDGG